MSNFDKIMAGRGEMPVSKKIEFYADCAYCDQEVAEADYYADDKVIIYTCKRGHRNTMKGVDLPL